jgi:hypothetical protein
MLQGTLTIDNSSFINNSSFESDGGAIYYLLLNSDPADDGAVSITNSIFTGNTATGNGGAISFITQPSLPAGQTFSLGISKNTFLTNTATGYGGAVSASNAAAVSTPSINYNRFVGNTSTALANTGGLNFIHSDGSVNAENNWWGCNFGPTASPCDKAGSTGSPGSGSLDADPWLQLKVTASPNPICNTNAGAGNTTTVTASFLSNSDDAPVAAANLSAFVGLPVTWSSSLGTLGAPQELTIQADGEAINTFTSDGTTGNASAGAKVDNIPPTDSDSRVTIVVNASSTAPTGATGTTTICTGSSTTLTVDGGSKGTGATTEWFTGTCGGTAAGTGDAITVSPAVTTTYYVRYTGTCNTTTCAEVTVTINNSSTAPTGATGTTTICSGSSTTLTVDGGSKGTGAITQWFTGSCGGTAAGTGDAITVSPSVTTTYYVRYSGDCNTTTCAEVTVLVNTNSTAPTGATGTTTICGESSTTLTVAGGSKGTGAITEWFTGSCGGTAAGTGDAITVSPMVTTTYYVRYSSDCNTTACASVTVNVNTFSTAPTGVTGTTKICNGSSTTLTVDGGSKGSGAVTQWFTGSCGGTATGTGDAITVSPSVTTTYYVRYSGACNTTTCAEVTVTVNTPSTAPTGVTGTTTICNGESTTLTVAGGSKGTGAITEWFTGSCGGTAAGTGDAITVSPTATTTYYVRYNGVCNATSCATVTVTVNTESTAPTGATGSTTICNGSSATLTVAGGIKGTGAIAQWFTGSCGGTSAGTGDAITVSPGTTTTYYVRYSGTCNTTSCATVTVTVSALSAPPTGATGTKTICSGSSTTLTVAGGLKGAGAVTQWFTGSCGGTAIGTGDAITVSPVATTTYYVRYSGGCNTTACAAVTVTVHNSVIATCSTNNSSLYYGYAGDQTATIKAIASGGTAPYTVSITMNRPLNCNVITSAGDELWAGVGGSSFNNVCPAAGPGLTPVSTGTVAASGGFYAVNVTLMQDAVFTATITDANGCIATCTVSVRAADARCFAGNSGNAKVKICHKTGNGCHAICVSASAVAAHLAHGDFIGECAANCEAPYYARGAVVAGKEEAFTDEKEEFNIAAYPNPSSTEFTLQVKGTATATVTVKVLDVNGVVRSTTVMSPKSNTIKLGNELKAGTYMVEVIQGTERKVLKLLKLN